MFFYLAQVGNAGRVVVQHGTGRAAVFHYKEECVSPLSRLWRKEGALGLPKNCPSKAELPHPGTKKKKKAAP